MYFFCKKSQKKLVIQKKIKKPLIFEWLLLVSRVGEIRTHDLLLPKQAF